MRRKNGLLVFLVLMLEVFGQRVAVADTLVERLVKAREGATASYRRSIRVECSQEIVERALDHPAFMGALWTAWGFSPKYRVTGLERRTDVHIEDPTGIVGDGWLVSAGPGRRVFLGEGQIDHWAVPMLNAGSVVIEIDLARAGTGTRIDIAIFVTPKNWLAGAVVGTFSETVAEHLGLRVTANLIDVKTMLEAIVDQPEVVAGRLGGPGVVEFEALFGGE